MFVSEQWADRIGKASSTGYLGCNLHKIAQQRQCGSWVHLSHQSTKGRDSLGLCYSGNQENNVSDFILLSLVSDPRTCGMSGRQAVRNLVSVRRQWEYRTVKNWSPGLPSSLYA